LYKEDLQADIRQPELKVEVERTDGSVVDITDDIISLKIKQTEAKQGNQLDIVVANDLEKYDIFNPNSDLADVFEVNNKIMVQKGLNGNLLPAGVYFVSDAWKTHYERGKQPTLSVTAFDRSKELLNKLITTKQYKNVSTLYVLGNILLNATRLTEEDLDFEIPDETNSGSINEEYTKDDSFSVSKYEISERSHDYAKFVLGNNYLLVNDKKIDMEGNIIAIYNHIQEYEARDVGGGILAGVSVIDDLKLEIYDIEDDTKIQTITQISFQNRLHKQGYSKISNVIVSDNGQKIIFSVDNDSYNSAKIVILEKDNNQYQIEKEIKPQNEEYYIDSLGYQQGKVVVITGYHIYMYHLSNPYKYISEEETMDYVRAEANGETYPATIIDTDASFFPEAKNIFFDGENIFVG
jgi:hypothetical protein